jgi:hypothetical protein
LLIDETNSRVVALTVIVVLLIALTSSDYSRASKHPLVDELDDTVDMLASIIQRAEKSRAAHPTFLADLKEILAGLQALPESLDELAASKARNRPLQPKRLGWKHLHRLVRELSKNHEEYYRERTEEKSRW